MRNRTTYLTALGAVLLASCGLFGSEEEAEQESSGYFTALLNGEPWRGEARGGINEGSWLTISAKQYDSLRYWAESIGFLLYFQGEGAYPLASHSHPSTMRTFGALYAEADDDALIAAYYPTDSAANRMTLVRFDSTEGVVEGTFEVTLVVDPDDRETEPLPPGVPPPMERRRPDTLRFTNGTFYVEIFDDRLKEQP